MSCTVCFPGYPRLEIEAMRRGVYKLSQQHVLFCPPKRNCHQNGEGCSPRKNTPPEQKKLTPACPRWWLRLLHLHLCTIAWNGVNHICYWFTHIVSTSIFITLLLYSTSHYNIRHNRYKYIGQDSCSKMETLKWLFTFRHTTDSVSHLRFLCVTVGSTAFWHKPNILSKDVGLPHPTHIIWLVFFNHDFVFAVLKINSITILRILNCTVLPILATRTASSRYIIVPDFHLFL